MRYAKLQESRCDTQNRPLCSRRKDGVYVIPVATLTA